MRSKKHVDVPLLIVVITLLLGGFLILASASVAISQRLTGSIITYTSKQIVLGGGIGMIFMLTTMYIPYRVWRKVALPFMIGALILVALLFVPSLSLTFGGARRWLHFSGFTFQPAEILKLAFVVYLASWLDARREEVKSISYGLVPFGIMLAVVSAFLIMQPDIGTLGTIVTTASALYFIGGAGASHLIAMLGLGAAAVYLLVQIAPYRLARILVFLNPAYDPLGAGYQINQSLIAIGSGGFWGRGFGGSLQKFNYLPEPMGDSIFAIFAEEMGFFGVLLLTSLLAFFMIRGLQIAMRAPDTFGQLLGAGIVVSIMVQALINIAAISGLLPLTGIPLPFISYGGTSLAVTLTAVGILLNISTKTSSP